MREDSKAYIRNLLADQDPLEPVDTGVTPVFSRDPEIKSVVFDIYGTLLVSATGDIDEAEVSTDILNKAFEAANISISNGSNGALTGILEDFENTVRIIQDAARKNSIPYPEIDVLSIWKIVLMHARLKNLVKYSDDADISLMTCVFEFLSNQVYPMPGMKEILDRLEQKNIPLGIVSNAQFYTPLIMNYFLNDKISTKERIKGIDWELTVLSYKLGKGKPDTSLFEELLPTLKLKYKLIPKEVLFVGNDMLKDIYAASKAGFKTALFAGDKRSLRMREDDQRINGVKPDFVITDLKQILTITG